MFKKSSSIAAFLALTGLAIFWGYNWVVMKIALRDAPPFDFAAMRAIFGALSLFLAMIALRKPIQLKATFETALYGLLQTTGTIGLITWALVSGGAGKTAVLNYTMPFWVLLFAWFLLGERLPQKQWFSVVLSLIGLIFVLLPLNFNDSLFSKSLAIASGICWALSSIVLKKLAQKTSLDLLSFTAWQMLFGSIPLLGIAIVLPSSPVQWTPSFIAALLYNIFPGTAIAWLLWIYALHQLPTGTASLGTLAIPVVGVLAAWLQLGEVPSLTEAIGIGFILAALLVNSFSFIQEK